MAFADGALSPARWIHDAPEGGAIDVRSAPVEGGTFTVLLPCAGEVAPGAGAAPEDEPLPRGRGERILVVDVERHQHEVARQLHQVGVPAGAAGAGDEPGRPVPIPGRGLARGFVSRAEGSM